jgi:hypothetical protein
MAQIFFTKADRKPSAFATLGLIVMLMAAVCLLTAGPILGFFQLDAPEPTDIFDWRLRVFALTKIILALGSFFTIIGILHGRFSSRVRMSWRAFVAVLLAGLITAPIAYVHFAEKNAPIHDVSTNLDDPPYFRILAERSYETSAPELMAGGRLDMGYSLAHGSTYPFLVPIEVNLPAGTVAATAQAAAEQIGFNISASRITTRQIEASYRDPVLQLTSYIVIRVRPSVASSGSILDIRAVSRVGVSDYGINARLIEKFKDQFNELLADADNNKE